MSSQLAPVRHRWRVTESQELQLLTQNVIVILWFLISGIMYAIDRPPYLEHAEMVTFQTRKTTISEGNSHNMLSLLGSTNHSISEAQICMWNACEFRGKQEQAWCEEYYSNASNIQKTCVVCGLKSDNKCECVSCINQSSSYLYWLRVVFVSSFAAIILQILHDMIIFLAEDLPWPMVSHPWYVWSIWIGSCLGMTSLQLDPRYVQFLNNLKDGMSIEIVLPPPHRRTPPFVAPQRLWKIAHVWQEYGTVILKHPSQSRYVVADLRWCPRMCTYMWMQRGSQYTEDPEIMYDHEGNLYRRTCSTLTDSAPATPNYIDRIQMDYLVELGSVMVCDAQLSKIWDGMPLDMWRIIADYAQTFE